MQRAKAILARRSHYWALAQETYATPVPLQQTREGAIPRTLTLSLETSKVLAKLRIELVVRIRQLSLASAPQ